MNAPAGPYPGIAALDFGTSTSTMTIYDPRELQLAAISPEQRATLNERLAVLLTRPPAGQERLRDELWRLVSKMAAAIPGGPRLPVGARAEKLLAGLSGPGAGAAMYDYTFLEVERARNFCPPQLRSYLDCGLADCYDDAFNEPTLSSLRLFKVMFRTSRSDEIPSTLYVPDGDLQGATLDHRTIDRYGRTDEVRAYRGLKQWLGRQETIDGFRSDKLIAREITNLLREAQDYLGSDQNQDEFAAGLLDRVVVTYPATASPQVRDELISLVRAIGPQVVTAMDEATAAAMFFVMRQFGGTLDPSIEAFAARSHKIQAADGTDQRQWQQHMLIIDIGGGSTDIALLRLHLTDKTPVQEEGSSPHYGRSYRLAPALLGTTGAAQRGGNYLTLLVFSWIKAMIADYLLANGTASLDSSEIHSQFRMPDGMYQPGSFVAAVLAGGRGPAKLALDDVDRIVPTSWRSAPKRSVLTEDEPMIRARFERLWTEAERAKLSLGNGQRYTFSAGTVGWIMEGAQLQGQAELPELDPEQFAELARPVLAEVMQLAAELVRTRLDKGQPLDRVILTGRSSTMPIVREEVTAALTQSTTDLDPSIDWDPGALWVEQLYAKHATSLGACWTEWIRSQQQDPDLLDGQLADGSVRLQIDIENLSMFLPATFEVPARDGGPGVALFQVGDPFLLRNDGAAVIESHAWMSIPDMFNVYRVTDGRRRTQWCHFNIRHHMASREADPVPPKPIFAKVEVSPALDMEMLLCRTRTPCYVVAPDGGTDLRLKLASAGLDYAARTHASIVVKRAERQEATEYVVLFGPDLGQEALMATFGSDQHPEGPTRRGAIADLPEPGKFGWKFYLLHDGTHHLLCAVSHEQAIWSAQHADADQAGAKRYTATIDEHDVLRVHGGSPAYRAATSLLNAVHYPGTVFRTPMDPAVAAYLESFNAFSGTH